ncbi:hypothetical protein AAHC03_013665 [Spirometra sp. Aus1]
MRGVSTPRLMGSTAYPTPRVEAVATFPTSSTPYEDATCGLRGAGDEAQSVNTPALPPPPPRVLSVSYVRTPESPVSRVFCGIIKYHRYPPHGSTCARPPPTPPATASLQV